MSETSNQPQRDFAATVEQLETLVERLESGELTLEDSLAAFEQGVRLTRDAQQRLDDAELKVRALTEGADGSLQVSPFAAPAGEAEPATDGNGGNENGGNQEEAPPW